MRWVKFRKQYIKENPLCVECLKAGRTTIASVCDHIIPISGGGDCWDLGNIQALCGSCHNKKTAKERNRTT